MKSNTYEVVQGLGSWVAFLSAGVLFPFSLEYVGVIDSMSIDSYGAGREIMGSIILMFLGVLVVTLAVKGALSVKEYGWYYRQEVAQKLHRLADKIARR